MIKWCSPTKMGSLSILSNLSLQPNHSRRQMSVIFFLFPSSGLHFNSLHLRATVLEEHRHRQESETPKHNGRRGSVCMGRAGAAAVFIIRPICGIIF